MSKIVDRIKKWLRVEEEIEEIRRQIREKADKATEEIRRQCDEEIARLTSKLETVEKEKAALEANRNSMEALSQLAVQYRDEKMILDRRVGRPKMNREPFNTTIDSDLKILIRLLEQRGELKRGKVANFINRSLRVWLQPMLSLLDEGDSAGDIDNNSK